MLNRSSKILLLKKNSICVRRALVVFVDVDAVLLIISLVSWVELDRLLCIEREPSSQNPRIIAFI